MLTLPSLRSMALFLRFWIIFIPIASTKNFAIASTSVARYAICLIFAMSVSFELLLSAVENLITEVFQGKRCIIGSPARLSFDTGILHLAHEDRVVALFYGVNQFALNKCRRTVENRRPQTTFVKGFPTDGIAFPFQGLEESKSLAFLILS